MIRRPPRSTRVRSSAASDVYKRQDTEEGPEGHHDPCFSLHGSVLTLRFAAGIRHELFDLIVSLIVPKLQCRNLGMMQIKGWAFRTHPRQRHKVVARRRRRRGPFERASPAPRIIESDERALARLPDVVNERQG